MLRIIKLFVSLLFFMMFVKTNAQEKSKNLSINVGANYNHLFSKDYVNQWNPRFSVQYKSLELGGAYYKREALHVIKNGIPEYPKLDENQTRFNVFVKYYLLDNSGFNIEFGFRHRLQETEVNRHLTRIIENPVTQNLDLVNDITEFNLDDETNTTYLSVGYTHKIVKGLCVELQVQLNLVNYQGDVYVHNQYPGGTEFNKEDIDLHNFEIRQANSKAAIFSLNLGISYRFGIK